MRVSFFVLSLLTFFSHCLHFQAFAGAPAGPLGKQFRSLLKWTTRASTKTPQSDGNVFQFEDGYLVETVVKGNELGVVPHKIRVSQDGELVAVDASSSNVVRITPPLSQYCRARLVAGSFKGRTGHVDGKPSEARFNNPRGVAMDDRGNVYVADVSNLAIRKIGDSGVTTIAGGKSKSTGYRDGPSDEAQFSNDFDVIYVQQTCSLLIVDRGNAAIRQISLYQEDCDNQQSSVSAIGMTPPTYESSVSGIGVVLVVVAVVTGYVACTLQQGIGSTIFSTAGNAEGEEDPRQLIRREKASPVVELARDDNQVVGGWVSLGQLILDLAKLSLEAVACIFALVIPLQIRRRRGSPGLTPLKDRLVMPEDSVVDNVAEHRERATASQAVPISTVVQPLNVSDIPIQEARQGKRRSSKPHRYPTYDAQTAETIPNQLSRGERSKSRHEKSARKDLNQVRTNVPHSGDQSQGRIDRHYSSRFNKYL